MHVHFCMLCSKTSASGLSKLSADAAVFEPKQQAEFQSEVIFELMSIILLIASFCPAFYHKIDYVIM